MSGRFYFRQWLAGRDFGVDDDVARSMRNFTYALGDRETREAVLVDPAYRPIELVDLVRADQMELKGVVATHYHADHVGGLLAGQLRLEGVAELRATLEVPVHVQADEVDWIKARTALGDDAFVPHHDGDALVIGSFTATFLHTPGHTPGSQCLLVEGRLLSGDTLFIDGCGRTDLPGGDAREMYRSLFERLGRVGDDVELFPGHLYSPESSLDMGSVRQRNYVLASRTLDEWLAAFGS